MVKTSTIIVQGKEIGVSGDLISLTDMVANIEGNHAVIGNWIRRKDTLEFLGLWESLNNAEKFKAQDFADLLKEAGTNRFALSPKTWIDRTGAIGLVSKTGKHGGVYAHKDIAFEFGSWISPMFKLYLIKEFQRLKEEEAKVKNLEWDYRRFLSKVNYRIHTDAVKNAIIPKYKNLSKQDEAYIYADQAEMLNLAVFGITSKQWRIEHPKEVLQGLNIRDLATVPQLTVLTNIESYHAILVKSGIPPKERLEKMKAEAVSQFKTLANYTYTYSIESPYSAGNQTSTFDQQLKGLMNVQPPNKKTR